MVNPDNQVFLHHVLDSCKKVDTFVKGMDYEQFKADERTISAVLREVSVIGEAAKRVAEDFRLKHPQIPWKLIFGMRNKLVHDYFGVDYIEVWKTATQDVPDLEKQVLQVLSETGL